MPVRRASDPDWAAPVPVGSLHAWWSSFLAEHPAPLCSPTAVLGELALAGTLNPECLPLPGAGRTIDRFLVFKALAAHDPALARLVEGHADAIAVLAEAAAPRPPDADATLGIWAAGSPRDVAARRMPDRSFCLSGRRRWCSGAGSLTHALVTAAIEGEEAEGVSLFLVPLDDEHVVVDRSSWPAIGMARTDTFDVTFDGVLVPRGALVGPSGWYVEREGFWRGGAGVAACWWGGASGVASPLAGRAASVDDPHARAAWGEVAALLWSMECTLRACARAFDRDPAGGERTTDRLAQLTRLTVARGATEVLRLVGDATGAEPLAHDAAHAQRVADLTVYLRQHHGARDAEVVSRLITAEGWPS